MPVSVFGMSHFDLTVETKMLLFDLMPGSYIAALLGVKNYHKLVHLCSYGECP